MRSTMPNSSNPEEASSQSLPEELLINSLYQQVAQILSVDEEDESVSFDVNSRNLTIPSSYNLLRLNNKKKHQDDLAIQFIIEQIRFNLEKVERIKAEAKKKEIQKSGKAFKVFNIFDDVVDRFVISISKSGSSDLKVFQFFLALAAEIVKPITLSISIVGDVWALMKSYLDETRVARKTSMGTAIVRIARSIVAIVLFNLTISVLTSSILFLLVGTAAVIYRDSYIAYQNRQVIKQQKITIQNEENTLEQYIKMGLDNDVIERQKAVLQKERDELDTLRNYRLKNNTRLVLDAVSTVGTILVIVGMFFPIFPPIMMVGLLLMATSTTFKALDKITNDGVSRGFTWLSQKIHGSNDIKKSSSDTLTHANALTPTHTVAQHTINNNHGRATLNKSEDTKEHHGTYPFANGTTPTQLLRRFPRNFSAASNFSAIQKADNQLTAAKNYLSPYTQFRKVRKTMSTPSPCFASGNSSYRSLYQR